jgi:putative ABC transport system permease protein
LLAAQVTFTVVLLVGAGLMLRSLVLLFDADRLLDTTNLFRVSVRLPQPSYPSAAERLAFFETVERQLEAVEPIASATVTTASPFIGAATWQLGIDGRAQSPDGPLPSVMLAAIGANYFDTLQLPLIRGRAFDSRDGAAGYESAIVNQRLAAMFFGHEDPIGRRIRLVSPNRKATPAEITATIVGISPTLRQNFFEDISPVVYVPYRVNPAAGTMLIVRTRADAGSGIAALRERIRAIDADAVAYNATAIETDRTQSRWGNTVFGAMIALAAGIALLLAAVGLYAVTAYGVTQRLQEIGVRLALGAEARSIVWLFVRRTLVPLGTGLALGLAGAIGVGRIIRSMLIQTSPTDPATFAAIVILLVSVALAAVLRPARRGARMDPAVVLRAD